MYKIGDRLRKRFIDGSIGANAVELVDILETHSVRTGAVTKSYQIKNSAGAVYTKTTLKDYMLESDYVANKSDLIDCDNLTCRELEVLKLLTTGLINKEIAVELKISDKTIKNHVSHIFVKIGVKDRTQAAIYAVQNNIVKL